MAGVQLGKFRPDPPELRTTGQPEEIVSAALKRNGYERRIERLDSVQRPAGTGDENERFG